MRNYSHIDLTRVVPPTMLNAALKYYDEHYDEITNKNYITVIDYSKSSAERRFFVINMINGKVEALHVAHGKGSDSDHNGYAEKFSNVNNSKATCLGFFVTGKTYKGSNGYSLKLKGMSATNSNAYSRAIVIHGADYVKDKDVIQGRSWGCPALSQANHRRVIDLIKDGSLVYSAIH